MSRPCQSLKSFHSKGDVWFSRFALCLPLTAAILLSPFIGSGAPSPVSICSFNVQFLGSSKVRDDVGLAECVKGFDVVVVQELIAPPYPGTFPNGDPFVPNPTARHFFESMKHNGFAYQLSDEDTGPGLKNHVNGTATEWFVAFYKPNKVKLAPDLPSGFLSARRTANHDFQRVPFAFAFRTPDEKLDFVLISVHLDPGAGAAHKNRRKHELASIASWIKAHDQKEKDFIVLGDMNIESATELASATPSGMRSFNFDCLPTNTNVNKRKPYDHVVFSPAPTGQKLSAGHPFHVTDLIESMRPHWKTISTKKYPGGPPYQHNQFRRYYSDHDPVDFQIIPPDNDDD